VTLTPENLITLVLLAPLVGAVLAGLFGRLMGDHASMLITTGLLFIACAGGWSLFSQLTWGSLEPFTLHYFRFIDVAGFTAHWSARFDTMSAVMLIVVTTVSALVHLYSIGYMAEDPHRPRFFAYLSLFTFAMLMLVTAADFMQMFFGWEGVGLASYLLIGFWFKKESASSAAIKAFVVNRVGDFGFALGIFGIFMVFGTIDFATLFPLIAGKAGTEIIAFGYAFKTLDLLGILLFIGAMGKSAQFFLHTWLPDAMEGPTPVSALIHAATMVTAGVYMVCLLSPLYEYAPIASQVITVIGAVTALFAATVGLAQNDIKRVIAYSTCSQLGYMFFAAGVGAYQAAMFHLFTHAFFKALLFLGAGSVIHGMHHEQDMRRMGGLAKFMPVTYAVMTIGTLAITGFGIPGTTFGFAGFFSKDAIIESAYAAGFNGGVGQLAFWLGITAAGLTAFYSWRLAFMTFNGPAPHEHGEHGHEESDHHSVHHGHDDHHGSHTPHESPLVMLVPLLVLSVGALFAGYVFADLFVNAGQAEFWKGAIYTNPHNHVLHARHDVPTWVLWSPFVVSMTGLFGACVVYLWKRGLGARIAARGGPLHTLFYNKWWFDEAYDFIFVRPLRWLGTTFWVWGDQKLIDGCGPNGIAALAQRLAGRVSKMQTGYVYHYAFLMLLGIAGLGGVGLWLAGVLG